MGIGKVVIDGVETKFYFGIDEEEIEVNEKNLDDTIDLKEVVEKINEESPKDK